MNTDVDYKAIAEQLQRELEQARLTILKMRYQHNPLSRVTVEGTRAWVAKNYFMLLATSILFSIIFGSINTIKELFPGRK